MNVREWFVTGVNSVWLACWAASLACAAASPHPRAIDTQKSVLTVRVHKAGVLSPFGHDHTITAPIARGEVDTSAHQVELYVNARALRVSDPEVSDKDRAEIEKNMLGREVLDAERHPEIVFRSTSAEPMGPESWKVHGKLTLHGQTNAVVAEVRERGGHYVGTARFRQTDFVIKPIKVAGGAIRVKNEIQIEFDIQLAR